MDSNQDGVSQNTKTYKDAFALFDKKGTGKIPVEHLGDLLRAVGQNPTLAEISDLQDSIKGSEFDFDTYQEIINRPGGFKPLGLPDDYIKGFQVFDKDHTGYIGVGELRYILTSIGEKLTDSEVDELLKGVEVTPEGNIDYVEFVKSILDQ
ncbi:uncharacterized protein KQ657_002521 [Scheffersomyces spartinae]|uniref:EF-hand domain-containing protein n=1 Tax=Scheffersomyces spartinae TaxID=45513 RepID=A0A9P7V6K3_9ASCO|nr:uncharacterized protein KQ657_002521 [Scheffersomyces spartinae]KAG7192156.1 hypothetical protein KQ657_002521 [Scheffersomyces spartinae]